MMQLLDGEKSDEVNLYLNSDLLLRTVRDTRCRRAANATAVSLE
jgi:hypothetical protein